MQSYYSDTQPTSPCPIQIMPSARQYKYQPFQSLVWPDQERNSWSPAREARALPIRHRAWTSNGFQGFRCKCVLIERLTVRWGIWMQKSGLCYTLMQSNRFWIEKSDSTLSARCYQSCLKIFSFNSLVQWFRDARPFDVWGDRWCRLNQ